MAKKPLNATQTWPWDLVQLTLAEASSIKAIASQHPMGYAAIVDKICGADRLSFTAGGDDGRRATDFSEGKRWVASAIRQAVDAQMPTTKSEPGPHSVPKGPPPPLPGED